MEELSDEQKQLVATLAREYKDSKGWWGYPIKTDKARNAFNGSILPAASIYFWLAYRLYYFYFFKIEAWVFGSVSLISLILTVIYVIKQDYKTAQKFWTVPLLTMLVLVGYLFVIALK